MLGYLTKEKSLVPWEVALSHLSHLNLLFRESNFRELLKKFTRNLLGPIYDTLGWVDKGNHVDRLLRVKVIRALIEADHKDAVEKTKEMFVAFKKENKTVPSNLRILVFSVGIMTGNQDDWNWCYDLYTNTNIPSDRALLLSAMGDSNDIFVLQKYVLFCFVLQSVPEKSAPFREGKTSHKGTFLLRHLVYLNFMLAG